MKRIFTLFILLIAFASAKAQLSVGDIAIIAMNADNNASPILGENFVFIALKDIPANTTITFTDNAWNANNNADTFRTNEGYLEWVHTAIVPAGTVITMNSSGTNAWTSPSPSIGTAIGTSSMAFSTDGDQIIAFEGTWATRPTSGSSAKFLYAFSLENFTTVEPTTSQVSNLPAALANFSVAMKNSNTETDNAYFANGIVAVSAVNISGSKGELLTRFRDSTLYFQSNTLSALPSYTITLPISLSSFNGSINNNKALLQWQTTSEINFSHFEIEKSVDGTQFTKIAAIKGTNSSGNNYSYLDEAINGITYYRLKNIDKDGTSIYSKTVKLENISTAKFQIFPNPVVNNLVVNHQQVINGVVIITTVEGKVLLQKNIASNASQTIVEVSNLQNGNYIIQLNSNGKVESKLFKK